MTDRIEVRQSALGSWHHVIVTESGETPSEAFESEAEATTVAKKKAKQLEVPFVKPPQLDEVVQVVDEAIHAHPEGPLPS